MRSSLPSKTSLAILSVLAASALSFNSVAAATLDPITGVSVIAHSDNLEGDANFTADGASLTAGPSGILGASDSTSNSGFSDGDTSDFGNFVTEVGTGFATYDLGANYNVTNLLVWNFAQIDFTFVGANSVAVLTSPTANGTFTLADTVTFNEAPPAPYGTQAQNPSASIVPSQTIALNLPNTRYIELQFLTNRYDASNPNELAGASSLAAINAVSFVAAPEPSTYAMILAGVAALALLARRKGARFQA